MYDTGLMEKLTGRKFKFSGMLHRVSWEMITTTYELLGSADVGSLFLRKVGSCLPADMG